MTRYLLLMNFTVLFFVGHPLWREDGSVFFTSYWPLPVQSFSGLSPLRLETKSQIWDFLFRRLLRLAGSRWRWPWIIILIKLCQEYKLWSSFRNFLQPPVTSSLFDPNIPLNTLFSTQSMFFL
jgi:hypothetical protein